MAVYLSVEKRTSRSTDQLPVAPLFDDESYKLGTAPDIVEIRADYPFLIVKLPCAMPSPRYTPVNVKLDKEIKLEEPFKTAFRRSLLELPTDDKGKTILVIDRPEDDLDAPSFTIKARWEVKSRV